jgi:hypothetical protein
MHLTILLLVFSMLFLVYGVVKSAQERDRDAPTDPNWYDIKHFTEAAEIIDDEDMRTLLDECLGAGTLDSGMTMRARAMISYFRDAPNSLHNPVARSTSLELAAALEHLLDKLDGLDGLDGLENNEPLPMHHIAEEATAQSAEGTTGTSPLQAAVARVDAAYLAYRSYFYDLIGE